jgi:hypothetical protein
MVASSLARRGAARSSHLIHFCARTWLNRFGVLDGATMPRQTLALRVDRLEERVTVLEQLPARIDALESQILQLREEMHREFSSVREETRAGDEETRRTLREEIRGGDEETRRVLRAEIRAIADEIMGQARTLYEAMDARLKIIQEGQQR